MRGSGSQLNLASISYWILYLSGAGEPKCKEAKTSAAAAAEAPEFPAATAASAAEFPKLPATAELSAAAKLSAAAELPTAADLPAAAELPELWCAAAAAILDPTICTACRICPPAGLWGKGSQMLEALG